MEVIQTATNEFASTGQPREVDAFLEFKKTRFPSLNNINIPPQTAHDSSQSQPTTASASGDAFEEDMYTLILDVMENNVGESDVLIDEVDFSIPGSSSYSSYDTNEALFLGKYIASLSLMKL